MRARQDVGGSRQSGPPVIGSNAHRDAMAEVLKMAAPAENFVSGRDSEF